VDDHVANQCPKAVSNSFLKTIGSAPWRRKIWPGIAHRLIIGCPSLRGQFFNQFIRDLSHGSNRSRLAIATQGVIRG